MKRKLLVRISIFSLMWICQKEKLHFFFYFKLSAFKITMTNVLRLVISFKNAYYSYKIVISNAL